MVFLSEDSAALLREKVDEYIAKPKGIPGLVCTIVNKDGARIFHYAAGHRAAGLDEPLDTNAIFWLASCTKLITSIAAMQLVEQKKLSLDDPDQLETVCPELKHVKVLEESNGQSLNLFAKRSRITLRMLLTHTAGFGYSFTNANLKKWNDPVGVDEFSGRWSDLFEQPLVNQPGERWEYGTGMDWVGLIVERVSGLLLDAYFQKFILEPLGAEKITFIPTREMKDKLVFMHTRETDGRIRIRQHGHLLRHALLEPSEDVERRILHSGGAGCFGSSGSYCEILSTLLNDGLHPRTGSRILQQETVEEMFKNQIPQFPNFGRQETPSSKPALIDSSMEVYPQPPDQEQGWGLSFFSLVHPSRTGRAAGTGYWSGLANLVWWVDRKREVAGVMFSQILPFGDKQFWECQAEVETLLYEYLSSAA
ncbi:beta-lactamase/transpeptidase-like protein [Aspergillus pseudoustus]|uniref:Beta-lactamase/transpeptidase-like protein n=1 Tax=Aspergillus pseudoustus TaxID=1810923 RepID=A0ABR4K0S0_9EURO